MPHLKTHIKNASFQPLNKNRREKKMPHLPYPH